MTPRDDADPPAVRRATAADAPEIARLLYDFQVEFSEPTPEIEVLAERYERLIAAAETIVLLAGEGPEGFAQLGLRRWVYSPGLCAYLEELYVVPDRRGHGRGRALLDAAIETARAEGATHIELSTSEEDRAARNLYESAGFTNREGDPDGPMMLYYEREI